MDFGFTEEQAQLQSQVRRFVDSECPLARVRELMASSVPVDKGLWEKAAGLGWQALTLPEEHGGLGLAWEDLVVIAEEAGRGLLPLPLVADAAAARLLARLGNPQQCARWLPAIATGDSIATIAMLEDADVYEDRGVSLQASASANGSASLKLNGAKRFVPYAQAADLLLVIAREPEGVSVFAVPADSPGVTIIPLVLVDATQREADVVFNEVSVCDDQRLGRAGAAWAEVARVLDAHAVALSAELVGAADAAVMIATEYAKVRKQFGHTIGRFQGVKHRLAELHVGVESARSLVYYAGWAVDHLEDARMHVSMAKSFASMAADEAGEDCIQIHGAIGYTWECDAQLYYKRGRASRNILGSPEWHSERVLSSQGL